MSTEVQVTNIVNEIMKVESIEEAFSCYLVQNVPEVQFEQVYQTLANIFTVSPTEQELGLKYFLTLASSNSNHSRLHILFTLLENLVANNVLPARMVCECILSCDKLEYRFENFWIECFILIRKIISGVDYKGIREIVKHCIGKAATLPAHLNSSVIPQMRALESVLNLVFDRNACLLPPYLIANEMRKLLKGDKWPHWKLAGLLSSFIESFRDTAQMVSIIGHDSMLPVVETSGCADYLMYPWKLDPVNLTLPLKGNLPYDENLLKPQTHLLRYVLEQPYSRDMVCSMLGLQKQHKERSVGLEEQFVELIMYAMEKSESELANPSSVNEETSNIRWLWLHLSSQLIFYVLFQFASFQSIVLTLHDKLSVRELKKGRDHLMWVLLQFISGSIQRNSLQSFLPVFKLYDLLYPDKEPLPVPDINKPSCTHHMSMICIWIHLLKKAQMEHVSIHRPIPLNLKLQHEFLQQLLTTNNSSAVMGSDYRIALLCNAFSTNTEYFSRPMAALVESILGNQKGPHQAPVPGMSNAILASGPQVPLSMAVLDSLTVHAKMSLIHSIVNHIIKMAQSKSACALAPALVETYSRLLVYTEIESLGIKGFISQLLPSVFKYHAWGILYTLLEMFNYRMHHIQPHYRVQLLSHLHSLAAVPQTNQTQLHLCVESTALRLITGLGSGEVQPQLSRYLNEPKTIVSAESEELNRTLVFTIARSMHVTGTGSEGGWCKELLNTIMQNTPLSWASHTLQCFPPALHEFFQEHHVAKENKQQLKKAVEEEYRNWASMNNENDIIAHFSVPGTPPLFLCLLWKMILETDRISSIAYKILERIGARGLSAHLRKFCDYVVFEVAVSEEGLLVNKCVDAINLMVWKYNIVTIDRLVLCMALRTHEGNEAQVCFFIIQLILFKDAEFRNRVHEFVKENSPQHWKQSNWHEKHLAFHRKYPEQFAPEGNTDQLPVYFGNVCLRFLPVFDIVIHRYLELPPVAKTLENILGHLGTLYKFHDRPVTYLYNTFHYYEKQLRDNTGLKRKLVLAVLGKNEKVDTDKSWCLSEAYSSYMLQQQERWVPELDYYIKLIKRIVDTIAGTYQFPVTDWRFNEFPNPAAQALYLTCVELMALPVQPGVVANNLLDVITRGYTEIPSGCLQQWINAVGLVMAALPDPFWTVLHERLVDVITCPQLTEWPYRNSPFQMFNFSATRNALLENKFSYTLAVAHAVWHHAGFGHLATIPQFVHEKLSPTIKTEEQMLFLCHLIGPFLPRFNPDRLMKNVTQLITELYTVLEQVDKAVATLKYMDPICDLLYHIKYMLIGDAMKSEIEVIIRRLRPALQKRLRFMVHLSIDEIKEKEAAPPPVTPATAVTPAPTPAVVPPPIAQTPVTTATIVS